MSLRFHDGFDHYASGDMGLKWNSVGSDYSIETGSSGRFSGFCTKMQGGGGVNNGRLTKILDSQQTWIVGVAWKTSDATATSRIISLNDAGTDQVTVSVTSVSKFTVTRNGTVLATGTTTILPNVWYYLEFKCKISSSIASGDCVFKVNGTTEVSLAAATNCRATANNSADRINLFADSGVTVRYDDLVVMDGTGASLNDFIGDVRIETTWASGAGTHTDFTPSTGSNYTCVDETQNNNDTDYVSSATVNSIDTYAMGDLASTPTNVFAVAVTVVHRKDDAGSHSIAPVIRVGGTDYVGTTASSLDSYSVATTVWTTNPNTGAAWTGSGVNGAEAGIKLVS